MEPIIGVLSTYNNKTQSAYIKAIEKSGGSPIIINRVDKLDTIKNIINLLDGILFTGGSDVNPLLYGEEPKLGLGMVDNKRDIFELELVQFILSKTNIPVLGICRGMQILNVALGGTLYQDLLSQNVTKVDHNLGNIYSWSEPSHSVNIHPSTKVYDLFKKEKILVNSLHHQGVKTLGENLQVSMISEDDIVEAIEFTEERFVLGLQWHPEMLIDNNDEYLKVFKNFVNSSIKSCHTTI